MKKLQVLTIIISAFFILTGFKNCPQGDEVPYGAVYEDNGANTYIVGDSRIYFMRESMENASDFNWIAVCGSGYYHLENQFKSILDAEDLNGKTIIIESGLNDIIFAGGADSAYVWYYSFYTTTAQDYIKRGATVKMLKLLPILPCSDHNIEMNDTVAFYNDALAERIPSNIEVIDLSDISLGYVDELHFDGDTSVNLYHGLQKYKAKDKSVDKKALAEEKKRQKKEEFIKRAKMKVKSRIRKRKTQE